MQQKFFKNSLLLFLIGIIIASCSLEEDYSNSSSYQNKVKIERKTFHELMKEEKFSTAFSKISKQKNLATGRTVMEVENDFNISNIPAKVVTYGNNISYNFLISRDSVNSNFFENLVVKVDSTNVPKAYILKYLLNSNPVFISEHNAYTLSAQTQITQINYNDSESKIEYYDGCTVVTLWCPYQGAHPATQACINEDRERAYRDVSFTDCLIS